MYCKAGVSLIGTTFLLHCLALQASEPEAPDWSKVSISVAMIRTSITPGCLGDCVGSFRGSKAKLVFPPEYHQLIEDRLGENPHKVFFSVHFNNKPDPIDQEIFFDFNSFNHTNNGMYYFERSSNYGDIKGPKCSAIYLYKRVFVCPLSIILNYVQFENSKGSYFRLYPKNKLEAKKTSGHIFDCAGSYVSQPAKIWPPDGLLDNKDEL